MTTITLEKEEDIKTNFIDVYDLYEYISEKYILPDLKFKGVDQMSKEEKEELKNAKNDNSKLINI